MLIIFMLCSDASSYYWASEAIEEFVEKKSVCLSVYMYVCKFDTIVPNVPAPFYRHFTASENSLLQLTNFTRTITFLVQMLGLVRSPPLLYIFVVFSSTAF